MVLVVAIVLVHPVATRQAARPVVLGVSAVLVAVVKAVVVLGTLVCVAVDLQVKCLKALLPLRQLLLD